MLATLLTFVILGRFVLRTRGGYRKQALAVFTGGFVVYLAVAGYFVVGPGLPSGFDPTPLFNAAMAIIVSFALFRLDFLDVVPVASDRLFEEMSDPVVVLASNETIAASNPASSALADEPLDGRELSQALPALADTLEANDEQVTLDTDDGERTYDVETSPLYDPYDRQQGRLTVLRDVASGSASERTGSTSKTTGRGSHPKPATTCSSPATRPVLTAPASGSRSSRASRKPTAGSSTSKTDARAGLDSSSPVRASALARKPQPRRPIRPPETPLDRPNWMARTDRSVRTVEIARQGSTRRKSLSPVPAKATP